MRPPAIAFALALVIGFPGCSTYQHEGKVMTERWGHGDLNGALAEYTRKAESKDNTKDAIIWRLEEATVLRAAGKFEESNKAFAQAEAKVDHYEEMAKTRLATETGALLSNQANLPYEGRAYDKIMLNTYRALNYLQIGDLDKARVELIRAYRRQQDAVQINQQRIEKVKEAAAAHEDKELIQRAERDPRVQSELRTLSQPINNIQPYADYVNPFSVYLDGLYFMVAATDGSDLERARKSLERVQSLSGVNSVVSKDLESLNQLLSGRPFPPTTYIIFETGEAPVRDQLRIDIPIIFTSVSYVGAAFPKLRTIDGYVPTLTVTTSETAAHTEVIANMDSVIGQDFKNELPAIYTKTIASTVIKATAAYGVNRVASQGGDAVHLLSNIITAGVQAAVNIADLRTWTTLPKEFQVCRVPTPADRKLSLGEPSGAHHAEVTVDPGIINLVYVRSIYPGTGFLVTQAKLK